MDIAVKIAPFIGFDGCHQISWRTRVGVDRDIGHHTANLKLWIDFFAFDHGCRTGNQLIDARLKDECFFLTVILDDHGRIGPNVQRLLPICLIIDLIESHPIRHFVTIPLKDSLSEFDKEGNHFFVSKPTKFFIEGVGHFKVGQSDHGFDAICLQFFEKIIVILETGFIWFFFCSSWIDPAPRNRCP